MTVHTGDTAVNCELLDICFGGLVLSRQLNLHVRVGRSPDGQVQFDLSPLLAEGRGIRAGYLNHRAPGFLHGKASAEEMCAEIGYESRIGDSNKHGRRETPL